MFKWENVDLLADTRWQGTFFPPDKMDERFFGTLEHTCTEFRAERLDLFRPADMIDDDAHVRRKLADLLCNLGDHPVVPGVPVEFAALVEECAAVRGPARARGEQVSRADGVEAVFAGEKGGEVRFSGAGLPADDDNRAAVHLNAPTRGRFAAPPARA